MPSAEDGAGLSRKAPAADPLTMGDAAALMAGIRGADRVLIAVSGGPDSVALMHLASAGYRAGLLPSPIIATVDHGLQSASRDVASRVVRQAEDLGLEAHLLRWEGAKPSTGLQAAARTARYRLLTDCARRVSTSHLLTAHTLDDQAETILFRLWRGSGPTGLAGMASSVMRDGIAHHRPLLGVPKQRLIATCEAEGWSYVDDPANRDPRYARTRLRAWLPDLAAEGLDAERLALLGRRLARDEAGLQALAAAVMDRVSLVRGGESKDLAADALLGEPAAVAVRVLALAMTDFARPGPPRLGRLEHLFDALCHAHAAGQPLRRTLHGHLVSLERSGVLQISREKRRHRGSGRA